MAFPAINAQQELNNRKILEELQIKKHLLTKSGGPTSTIIPGAFTNNLNSPQGIQMQIGSIFQQQQQQQSQQNDRAAWLQATSQSSGFFLHTDSAHGNNILPVLPRFEPPQ